MNSGKWVKLEDGSWGIETFDCGAQGETATVRKANGATSKEVLGELVKEEGCFRTWRKAQNNAARSWRKPNGELSDWA